jgi:glycosyltransferase involved in cell wall biosynthesis
LDAVSETHSLIRELHLEHDVVSVGNLPADVHAALFSLAALTVVPSLFEGGFPFPFTESLSVDTPVVMSSIPVTRELLPPETHERILFHPYSTPDIAAKIRWGLEHRDELLRIEQPIYQEMAERTWDVVADEFRQVCQRVAVGKPTGGSIPAPHWVRSGKTVPTPS